MKHTTTQNIKFLRLKRRLKLPHWGVVGILQSIWTFAMNNAKDGGIGRYSNDDLAAAVEWDGNPDEFVRALLECGWLNFHDEARLVIHDWHEHAPRFVHGALAKSGKSFLGNGKPWEKTQNQALSIVTSIGTPTEAPIDGSIGKYHKLCDNDENLESIDAPIDKPIGTPIEASSRCHQHNITQHNITNNLPSEGSPETSKIVSGAATPSEPSLLDFPVDGKTKLWPLTQSWLDGQQQFFPQVDCLAEAKKSLAWLLANPEKRKTAVGMPRFLNRWFSRASDAKSYRPAVNGNINGHRKLSINESVEKVAREMGLMP